MSNERFDSVWDAIEDTPAQAENLAAAVVSDDGAVGAYQP